MRIALVLGLLGYLAFLFAASPRALPVTPAPALSLEALHFMKRVPAGHPLNVSFCLRNLSGIPTLVQRGEGSGYSLRAELLDPSGNLVPSRTCGTADRRPATPGDFETIPPGGWSSCLGRTPFAPTPRVPGKHLLRFIYLRAAPAMPALWELLSGRAEWDTESADLMQRAWTGALSGEIEVEVR